MAPNQSTTWEQFLRGSSPGRSDSFSSAGNHSVRFEEQALLGDRDARGSGDAGHTTRRRRRSSATNRLAAVADIGGVNSIRSFSRSWQRAAIFPEVIPQRPPSSSPQTRSLSTMSIPSTTPAPMSRLPPAATPRASLLRQHLERGNTSEEAVADADDADSRHPHPGHIVAGSGGADSEGEGKHHGGLGSDLRRVDSPSGNSMRSNSIFSIPPHLAAPPLVGSYGSYRSYGTVDTSASRPSMAQAADLWRQQQETGANVPDGERPAIMVKEVEQEGRIVLAVSGQSTLPQTVVNSTNVLIGVGLLSLPMGLKYAGWLCGMVTLFLCAAVTSWTARILAKCMDLDPTVITFSDIAYISFGRKARVMTAILFTMELMAACVALIVLFADSLALLFPGVLTVTQWKVICTLILIPLQFAPLSLLSFTSFVGILSCFSIVLMIILCGLLKPDSPGSLLEPAVTYMFPANWLTLPLSFGLLMSPWGGHSVFPNIYRDMRHPYRYKEAVTYTFSMSYVIDASVAVVGLIMFGDDVRDEITASILETTGYPEVMNVLLVIAIAIIPLTKIPLNAQPIVTTLEVLFGLRQQAVAEDSSLVGMSSTARGALKGLIRILVLLAFLAIAILFPAFDVIMAFMGSALCFTICVTLPLAFYLKLFGRDITAGERLFSWVVMLISLSISIVGTVWAFLPKSLIAARVGGNGLITG